MGVKKAGRGFLRTGPKAATRTAQETQGAAPVFTATLPATSGRGLLGRGGKHGSALNGFENICGHGGPAPKTIGAKVHALVGHFHRRQAPTINAVFAYAVLLKGVRAVEQLATAGALIAVAAKRHTKFTGLHRSRLRFGGGAFCADQLGVELAQLQCVVGAVGCVAAFPPRNPRLRNVGPARDLGLREPEQAQTTDQFSRWAHAHSLYDGA